MHLIAATTILATSLSLAAAGDWPQYNGSSGDRTSAESVGLVLWPSSGPPVVWKTETNLGFSSFAVAGEHVFTLVTRELDGKEREVCVALEAASGKETWAALAGRADYDGGGGAGASGNKGGDGPRSTPSVDGDRVYVLNANLQLFAFERATGKQVWNQDILADFDGRNIHWQNAASPLVEGELVYVAGGGAGQSLLAFDKHSGELVWKCCDETMTHATPIAATIHGKRMILFLVRSGLVAVDPADGSELWRQPFDYRTSTAASPVVYEEVVYVSAGYGVGAGAFIVNEEDGEFSTELLWRKRNDLMNHWSTPACKDGYLYGMFSFKKYGDGPLQCVELATGEVQWSKAGFGPGNCIVVGDTVIALSDAGEVVLADASPKSYTESARAAVLDGKCWSSPAFSDGQLYVRSTEEGARLDLSGRDN